MAAGRTHQIRISARATNLGLLALVVAGVASGLGCFLAGSVDDRWVLGLHSMVGFTLVVLLYWKRRIILRSIRRQGAGLWLVPSVLLLALLLAALLSGILWSTTGLPPLAGESGLTLHAALSVALAVLLVPHARAGWPRLPARFSPSRRSLFTSAMVLAGAVAAWRGSELASSLAQLSGARRRFTSSRDAGSFNGNDFPANAWLLDDPAPLDLQAWRLRATGRVQAPFSLALAELVADGSVTATIDCTGGWYSTQVWQGRSLADLLAQAQPAAGARSVVVRSATGYRRRFSITAAREILLATMVNGEPLAHEHGAPVRLVAPGRRGYDWVKWVTAVEVSSVPAWLNWPLPLS